MKSQFTVLIVLVCFLAATVVAFNPPAMLWKTKITAASKILSFGDPEVRNGAVYEVGRLEGNRHLVVKLNANTGDVVWQKLDEPNDASYCALSSEEVGLLYVATTGGVVARDIHTGAVKWVFNKSANVPTMEGVSGWSGKPTYTPDPLCVPTNKGGSVFVTWYNTPYVQLDAMSGGLIATSAYTVGGRIWINPNDATTMVFPIVEKKHVKDHFSRTYIQYSLVKAVTSTGEWIWKRESEFEGFADSVSDAYMTGFQTPSSAGSGPMALWILNSSTGAVNYKNVINATTGWDYNTALNSIFQVYMNDSTQLTTVTAFNKDGNTKWKNEGQINTNKTAVNCYARLDLILLQGECPTYACPVVALDAVNGDVLWSLTETNPQFGYYDGRNYFFASGLAATDGYIQAVRVRPK